MKTKNNVQKATTRLLALGFIFVVTSISLNAQNLEKSLPEAGDYNQKVLAMIDNTIETYSSSTVMNVSAPYLVAETEETLELEAWMTDETIFDVYSIYLQPEQEKALELEDWMIDESYFNPASFQLEEETEPGLELEGWMTSDVIWNI